MANVPFHTHPFTIPEASEAQAVAGTSTDVAMTPKSTKQSIASEVGLSVASARFTPSGGVETTVVDKLNLSVSAFDRISPSIQGRVKARATTTADGIIIRAALQAQIDALSAAGGGIINFPAGLYLLDSRLTVGDKVILWGAGKGATTLKLTAYNRVVTLANYSGCFDMELDAGGFASEETTQKLNALAFFGSHSIAGRLDVHGCYTGVGMGNEHNFISDLETHDNVSRGIQFDGITTVGNIASNVHSYNNGNAGAIFGHGAHNNIINGLKTKNIGLASIWFSQGSWDNQVNDVALTEGATSTTLGITINAGSYRNRVSGGVVTGHGRVVGFTGSLVDGVYPEIVNHETELNIIEGLLCVGTDNTNPNNDAVLFNQDVDPGPTANFNIVRNCSFDTFYSVFRNGSDAANGCDISDIKTRNIGAGGIMNRMKSASDVVRLRNIQGFPTKIRGTDGTIAADSVGVKTIVINHGLGFTPSMSMITATISRETVVADVSWKDLWVVSITGSAVTVRVTIVTASATVGAKLRVNIVIDSQAEEGFALSTLP